MSTPPIPQLTPAQLNYAETAQWKAILSQALADLRCAIPAIVEEVNYENNPPTVTVQIAVREIQRTVTGPQHVAIDLIANVPIVLPAVNNFALTMPVKAKDEGLLVFCDMCIDLWWTRGGVQNQLDFDRNRRHHLSDCGFIPGMRSQKSPINNWSQTSAQLRKVDGSAYIELTDDGAVNIVAPGGVNINGDTVIQKTLTAQEGVSVTGDVDATGEGTFNGIAVSTHQHSGVVPGGGASGPPIP